MAERRALSGGFTTTTVFVYPVSVLLESIGSISGSGLIVRHASSDLHSMSRISSSVQLSGRVGRAAVASISSMFGSTALRTSSVVNLSSSSRIVAYSGSGLLNETIKTYAMTLSHFGVTSHTTGYYSYLEVNGVIYAVGSSGIVVVGGTTDSGSDIVATIRKEGMDFGSPLIKKMTKMYCRMSSNGSITMRVLSEKSIGTITVADSIAVTHGCKINLPRGVSGRELGIEINNVDGSWFKIGEFIPILEHSTGRMGRQVVV